MFRVRFEPFVTPVGNARSWRSLHVPGRTRKGSKGSDMTRPPGRPATTACCAKKSYRVVFERRSNPLGGRSNRLSSSFEAASERRRSDGCRPLHYDKPGSFKIVHKSGGDDLGHDLVRVVDALAALISQCEGEGGGNGVRGSDASSMLQGSAAPGTGQERIARPGVRG